MKPTVIFQPSGRQGQVEVGLTLLEAARQLGVDVDSICGGRQTCGKCKVVLEIGEYAKFGVTSAESHASPMGVDEQQYFTRHTSRSVVGGRLACAARITDDLLVTVPPESQQRKQVIGKGANSRPIAIDPIFRQCFVEVTPHALGERDGDWERLQQALQREWQLADLEIVLPALRTLTAALKAGKQRVTVTIRLCQHAATSPPRTTVIAVRSGFHDALFGIAIDVGSTTIAAHLCDLETGETLATETGMNPQTSFGEDLMSRISYVMLNGAAGLTRLTRSVIETINQLVARAVSTAQISREDVVEVVLVGNTVMHHLLLGIDPTELGAAPFTLATHAAIIAEAVQVGLDVNPVAQVYFPALEAGHVGSDNLAVLISEEADSADLMTLFIDVGTNAEIVLGNKNGLWSCSSPTGPAFEGGQITHGQRAARGAIERVRIDPETREPRFKVIGREAWSDDSSGGEIGATGICGSGIIEVMAELFRAGLLRGDGRFAQIDHPRLKWLGPKAAYVLATSDQTSSGMEIVVTQDDVRNIQLAKAALHAGCKLLMRKLGVRTIDRIVLAGAFGSYIDPLYAMVLGLIPDCDLAQVQSVGNGAGDGARIMLLNKQRRAESALLARRVHYIETAIDPNFQEEFVGAMHLPHKTDPYPTLRALGALPAAVADVAANARALRRERRRQG